MPLLDIFSLEQIPTIPYTQIQNVTADRILGRLSTNGVIQELTSTQIRTLLNVSDGANNYTLPVATSTVFGGVELFSDTVQTVAANAVTATASRTYGIQLNSSGQMVVNVPWVDTNTVYTHPAYTTRSIDTSGAQVIDVFTSDAIGSVTNITTRTMTLADLGYTGATNADNYASWLLAASGTAGTSSITSGATVTLSAGTGMSVTRATNTVTFATTITQYTDALARAAISLTTTGSSGAATYSSSTGILNVPNYTLAGLGGEPAFSKGSVVQGAGMSITGTLTSRLVGTGDITIAHLDTSSQATVTNANGTLIQSVTLDTYGHVTALSSLDGDARWSRVLEVLSNSSTWSHVALQNGIDFNGYTTGSSGFPSTLGFAVAFYAATSDSTSGFGRAFAINREYNTENYYLGSPNTSGVHNGWRLIYHAGNLSLSTLGGVPTTRTLTINGTSFDLSANRSWTISETDTLATVTSRGFITRNSSGAFATNTQGTPGLEVYGAGTTEPAYMTFHRPGVYAVRFGLDGTDLKVGGWSMGNVGYKLWHEGNFTPGNYVPWSETSYQGVVDKVARYGTNGYLLIDNWIRVGTGSGLYTNSGAYFFNQTLGAYNGWTLRSSATDHVSMVMQQVSGTSYGAIYADSTAIGFTNSALNSWSFRVASNGASFPSANKYISIGTTTTSTDSWMWFDGNGAIRFNLSGASELYTFSRQGTNLASITGSGVQSANGISTAAPSGDSNPVWRLGSARTDTIPNANRLIRVDIGGVSYDILCRQVV
jgi:hypothetical protein